MAFSSGVVVFLETPFNTSLTENATSFGCGEAALCYLQPMTRRELVLVAPAALLAQPPQSPQPPLPKNAEEELAAAREAQRRNYEQMAKVALPMATEPAVHFRA